jgi:UTP--glucose-1-phosphate uridylyltransferase
VLCAKEALGEGPFMLMLGDHLYSATTSGPSCTEQVASEYKRSGSTIVGLKRSPAADVSAFGCATGSWLDHDDTSDAGRRLLAISEMAEKPSLAYAREKLMVPTLPDDEFLTAFGLYVLTPTVFPALEHLVAHNLRGHGGEYQLTEALEHVRRTEGLTGVVVDGKRYDLGTPEHYLEAIVGLHAGRGASESGRSATVADISAGPTAASVAGSASGAAASASPV